MSFLGNNSFKIKNDNGFLAMGCRTALVLSGVDPAHMGLNGSMTAAELNEACCDSSLHVKDMSKKDLEAFVERYKEMSKKFTAMGRGMGLEMCQEQLRLGESGEIRAVIPVFDTSHGDHTKKADIANAKRQLVSRLEQFGIEAEFKSEPTGGHGEYFVFLEFKTEPGKDVLSQLEQFLQSPARGSDKDSKMALGG